MSQALQTTKPNTDVISRITEFQSVAKVFSESGLFTDVKGQSQCFVKIMAGAELGIPPFTAMNSFHIIKGKVTMTANTIAARVKASGRYNFRVVEKTADKCVIEFSEDGKPVYTETWDAKRARQAGTQNMDKYPDAMLFARCVTSGARAVCPDVVGQFYTPEEMGAKVNEDGEVIQGESHEVLPTITVQQVAPPTVQQERNSANMNDKSDLKSGVPFAEKEAAAKLGGTVRTEPPAPAANGKESPDQKRARLMAALKAVNAELATAGLLDVLDETKPGNDTFADMEAKIERAEDALDAAKLKA